MLEQSAAMEASVQGLEMEVRKLDPDLFLKDAGEMRDLMIITCA